MAHLPKPAGRGFRAACAKGGTPRLVGLRLLGRRALNDSLPSPQGVAEDARSDVRSPLAATSAVESGPTVDPAGQTKATRRGVGLPAKTTG